MWWESGTKERGLSFKLSAHGVDEVRVNVCEPCVSLEPAREFVLLSSSAGREQQAACARPPAGLAAARNGAPSQESASAELHQGAV